MIKLMEIIPIATVLTACASNYYGHSKEEWDNLTPEQQKEAKANIKELKDQQYKWDLTDKKVDDLFGSRSNKF